MKDFKRLLYNSKNSFLKSMWPEGAEHITKTTKRPLTAGTLFKNSMLALMKTIHLKEPHYVRCIKPNDAKSPVLFDQKLVEHQVNYLYIISYHIFISIYLNLNNISLFLYKSDIYVSNYLSPRLPTSGCWRTCGCAGRGSPTDRSTGGSSGEQEIIIEIFELKSIDIENI